MFTDTTASVLSSLGSISTDIFGALGLIILLTALGLSKGKSILFTLVVALYPAAFVAVFFPFYGSIQVGNNAVAQMFVPLAVFLCMFALTFVIIRPYVNAGYQHHSFWRIVEIVALSFCVSGLMIAIFCEVVDIDTFYVFNSLFLKTYATQTALFVWSVATLAVVPMYVRKS